MREDIFGGLKNALDKGYDLETAVRSFISSGYPEAEVRQAAQALTSGLPPPDQVQNPQHPKQTQQQMPVTQKNQWPVAGRQSTLNKPSYSSKQVQANQQVRPPIESKHSRGVDWKLITLLSVLIILIVALGASFFLRDSITEFFAILFG